MRQRIDDYVARYRAGEDLDDPTGRGSLTAEEHAILERLYPDVAAQMDADAEAAWAETIEPQVRDRVDDYVARYQAGEDLDDSTGRGSLEADERAILERLHPDVAAQMTADGEAAWAETIEPGVRDRIDDYIARYQAGEQVEDPTGRGSLDAEERAILERLHPDIAAEMAAAPPPVAAAAVAAPVVDDDVTGEQAVGASQPAVQESLAAPLPEPGDGVVELEQIEMAVPDPLDLELAAAVAVYVPPETDAALVEDEGPIDYGASINDDPEDYQPA